MRKDMKRINDRLVALLGAVLCVCACLVGCERKEAASPEPSAPSATNAPENKAASRADDTAYQTKLKDHLAAQRDANVERARILARMEQVRERARKALPQGASDEQVTAELEGNPRQYPAWGELVSALKKNAEEINDNNAAARAAIRRRILREVAEQTSAKK